MNGDQVTAASLAALARVNAGLLRALEASFDDEPEPYTAEDRAMDEWADAHPEAQVIAAWENAGEPDVA